MGDCHLVTIPQGSVGDRLPWGGERQGGGRVLFFCIIDLYVYHLSVCPPSRLQSCSTMIQLAKWLFGLAYIPLQLDSLSDICPYVRRCKKTPKILFPNPNPLPLHQIIYPQDWSVLDYSYIASSTLKAIALFYIAFVSNFVNDIIPNTDNMVVNLFSYASLLAFVYNDIVLYQFCFKKKKSAIWWGCKEFLVLPLRIITMWLQLAFPLFVLVNDHCELYGLINSPNAGTEHYERYLRARAITYKHHANLVSFGLVHLDYEGISDRMLFWPPRAVFCVYLGPVGLMYL